MTGQEQTQEPLSLSDLLKKLIEMGGSDLHLTTNTPPQVRVDGHLRPVDGVRTLTSADTKALAYSVLTDAQKHRFEENLELDFSFGVRGLSRLLRRNPTEAERALWNALVNDRRFAGRGFKRQVPVGPHITDFVSFPLRVIIDLVPPDESAAAAKTRAARRAWLAERDYRVVEVRAEEVDADVGKLLDRLNELMANSE